MRTILTLDGFLNSLEDIILFDFIPAITDGHFSDNDHILLSLLLEPMDYQFHCFIKMEKAPES